MRTWMYVAVAGLMLVGCGGTPTVTADTSDALLKQLMTLRSVTCEGIGELPEKPVLAREVRRTDVIVFERAVDLYVEKIEKREGKYGRCRNATDRWLEEVVN